MSIFSILETLLIGPLKMLFEIIFVMANRALGDNPGLAIVALSLLMNIMVLPLYKRADAMQEEARDKDAQLREGVAHIKKVFSGDERMMILQTYYRQNDYRPTDVLNGSVSLLLEVPFFMAAYQFLSHLALLNNVSFGPIANLGAPDGMLVLGGVAINVLPIAMTLINVVSSAIYLKGFPLKTKIQLYAMAAFFLVFLYNSPAGLVFYWTLNNVFSLGKNILGRLWKPAAKDRNGAVRAAVGKLTRTWQPDPRLFTLGSVLLTVLTGLLIPSAYISASAQEFIDPTYFHHPLLYVLVTACMAAGTFLVWLRVFYWLANDFWKAVFDRCVLILCGAMLVNYMFFGRHLGVLMPNLQFEAGYLIFTSGEKLLNPLVLLVLAAVLLLVMQKWQRHVPLILLTAVIALGGMSAVNMAGIHTTTRNTAIGQDQPGFTLSRDGKNVVVIMMDRAVGQLVPYLMNEKPELLAQFDGFTHYRNTVSHGNSTVFGVPGIYGGYEYTPVEMNIRDDVPMVEKHNEALKVMPVLFDANGYQTTVLNPTYANYAWIPDLSIYGEYPGIKAYNTDGVFVSDELKQAEIDGNYRNFFCFSIMKTMPVFLQSSIYASGTYNHALSDSDSFSGQVFEGLSAATGLQPVFMDDYSVLANLPEMTRISQNPLNTCLLMDNGTAHEPVLLQAPDYVPADRVDNTAYDAAHADRFTVDGRTLQVEEPYQIAHYHANMAAMLQLGRWFDYLREQGVYDNTRIILVSDHGYTLQMLPELLLRTEQGTTVDMSIYNALLMVKDFDAAGFTVSDEFMTNADVPALAVEGIIAEAVNPFTGKTIDTEGKTAHDQMLILSNEWQASTYTGNTFNPSSWIRAEGDLWDMDRLELYEDPVILTEYEFPRP